MKKYKFNKGSIDLSSLNIDIPKYLQDRLQQKKADYVQTVDTVLSSFTDIYKESYDENDEAQVNRNKDVLYLVELYNKDSEELTKQGFLTREFIRKTISSISESSELSEKEFAYLTNKVTEDWWAYVRHSLDK